MTTAAPVSTSEASRMVDALERYQRAWAGPLATAANLAPSPLDAQILGILHGFASNTRQARTHLAAGDVAAAESLARETLQTAARGITRTLDATASVVGVDYRKADRILREALDGLAAIGEFVGDVGDGLGEGFDLLGELLRVVTHPAFLATAAFVAVAAVTRPAWQKALR